MIAPEDLKLLRFVDSPAEAFDVLRRRLRTAGRGGHAPTSPGRSRPSSDRARDLRPRRRTREDAR